jgi:tetratricopeptide (TPR) repeat protein
MFCKYIKDFTVFSLLILLSVIPKNVYSTDKNNTPNLAPALITTKEATIDNTKVPTEQEIIRSIEEIIKPTKLDKESIEINYGFNPSQPVNLTGKDNTKTQFSIKVSDQQQPQASFTDIVYKGYQAALVGQYEASIYLYKKALAYDPDNINILYTLGTLYHKLKQLKEANYYYKLVLAAKPSHKKALNNFISVIGEESPNEALKELLHLAEINPNYSPVLAQIGMIYAKQEKYEDAEKYLRKSIIISPNEIIYKYNLAVMYDKLGKYKGARKLYQDVLEASYSNTLLPQSYQSIRERLSYLQTK